jgi:serine/threonine protein kinase
VAERPTRNAPRGAEEAFVAAVGGRGQQVTPPAGEGAAKARAAAMMGRVISGRYRIDDVIAMGGMGAVYRGEHLLMRKRVAIKILHPDIENLPELVERFETEAIAGAHIRHPSVASATDFGQLDDGSYFLVLEYVRGTTLSEVIQRGPMAPERVVHIARQIATALQAVHDIGIIHRDLKPRNVMVAEGPGDVAKLVDFGLAKVALDRLSTGGSDDKPRNLTGAGVIIGTVAYLAPEAARGMEAVDARSDLYALGVVTYEMLAGCRPFVAASDRELFQQHQSQPPPRIAERAPGVVVPPAIEAVVMRLLEKTKKARFQSAAEVIAALDAAASDAGIAALPAPPSSVTPSSAVPVVSAPGVSVPESSAPQPPPSAPHGEPSAPRRNMTLVAVPSPRTGGSRWPVFAIGAAGLAVVAGAAAIFAFRGDERPPAVESKAPEHTRSSDVRPSASTSARPSAAPVNTPSASAPPPPVGPKVVDGRVDGLDAAAWKAHLLAAPGRREWPRGAQAAEALAALEPAAFRNLKVRGATSMVAVGMARAHPGPAADQLFDLLSQRLGPEGLDVLYDMLESRGGTEGAKRAKQLLEQPELVARASPALRIALELRAAACETLPGLFDRAASEGDARAYTVLSKIRVRPCASAKDPCCFRKNKELGAALKKLAARL